MVESLLWLVRYRLERILSRRLAGRNATAKSLPKQADRTEFHRSRKLVTAARAAALGLRAHSPNHSTTTSAESGIALRCAVRTPPASPFRSKQTGQNSIAPENSLPQLGQVRWGSVLIFLTILPRPQPKAAPRSAEQCEPGQHSSWRTVFLLHEQSSVALTLAHQITFQNKFPAARVP